MDLGLRTKWTSSLTRAGWTPATPPKRTPERPRGTYRGGPGEKSG